MPFLGIFQEMPQKMKTWWTNSDCMSVPLGIRIVWTMQRIQKVFSHLLSQVVVLGIVGTLQVALAQNSRALQGSAHQGDVTTESSRIDPRPPSGSPERKTAPANDSALVIGPGDELEVTVYGAPDLSGHTRVSADGNISLPLIGYVRIAGLSSSEAAGAIEAQFRQGNVVNNPQVSVYVKEYTSSGISVAGEVTKPGFYSAVGPHRLFDVLQTAGAPTDKAANKFIISHQDQKDTPTLSISTNPGEL